jgi:hypothetical protein|tara:strand:+ start:826 stop:1167 length:342 start_codon:yes stop_codon:yes gene_type:complete
MLFPGKFDSLAYGYFFRCNVDNIGKQSRSFIQINPGDHIRNQVSEEGMITLTNDAEGIHSPFAFRFFPSQLAVSTSRAVTSRIEDDGVAVFTLLVSKFFFFACCPEFSSIVFV